MASRSRSSLRLALLVLLADEPNSGYGLGRLLANERKHVWSARTQQIYSELAQLDSDGLLSVETTKLQNRPDKKIHSFNRAGLAELRQLLIEKEPGVVAPKDELLVQILAARHAPQAVLSRLATRSNWLERQIAELAARLDETDRSSESEVGLWITLDAALVRAKADAGWCKRAIATLRRVNPPQS